MFTNRFIYWFINEVYWCNLLSNVFSVKIKRELKEKMEKYKDRIDWANEVRKFIEEIVRKVEAEENFKEILKALENAKWSVPKGFAKASVREDRDSG